jgi:predicted Zn-dependent peptidase
VGGAIVEDRPTEQAHLVLGMEGLSRQDERRYALAVLNNALGGGMSSRLFQEVREQRGLAYSVYSYSSHHHDTGMVGIYAGCAPGKVDEVLQVCREQLDLVATKGVTDEEIARAKGQLRGSLVLGLEDTGSQMSRIGKAELVYGEVLPVEEVLARFEAVTPDDVRDVAADVLRRPLSLGIIGPFPDRDFAEVLR